VEPTSSNGEARADGADVAGVLALRNGQLVPVRLSDVERAAVSAPAGSDDRLSVVVGSREVSAVDVVAMAASRPTTEVPTRAAVRLLEALGFVIQSGGDNPLTVVMPGSRNEGEVSGSLSEPRIAAREARGIESLRGHLGVELARAIRRHRGEWVAIRDGDRVASGRTFREVVDAAGITPSTPAKVFFVPRSGAAANA
jgi:hypothetical protein